MVFDKPGNMYGLATLGCGAEDGCGKIFKVPVALLDGSNPAAKVKVPLHFSLPTTSQPIGMVRDKAGNLFGIENAGGDTVHLGAVWEVSPPVTKNGAWTGRNIHEFCLTQISGSCDDGYGPAGMPAIDGKGDLFGTTQYDGGSHTGNGTVWTLVPPSGGGDWTFGEVHVFRNPQNVCSPIWDYGVDHPQYDMLLDSEGANPDVHAAWRVLRPLRSQSVVDLWWVGLPFRPSPGGDKIVSKSVRGSAACVGAVHDISSPSLMGDTVFGTSAEIL